jgi:hypothetical protein
MIPERMAKVKSVPRRGSMCIAGGGNPRDREDIKYSFNPEGVEPRLPLALAK